MFHDAGEGEKTLRCRPGSLARPAFQPCIIEDGRHSLPTSGYGRQTPARGRRRRQKMHRLTAAAIVLTLALARVAIAAPADTRIPSLAFFGFQLINTSLEPTTPVEVSRIKMLDDLFWQKLGSSGRFKIVPIPPELQKKMAAGPEISGCNGCERDYARSIGANWAAWGIVQKVSNLILNINVYMEDAASGKLEFVKSVDIRGNTDESWQHGLDYMLRHYLFEEP